MVVGVSVGDCVCTGSGVFVGAAVLIVIAVMLGIGVKEDTICAGSLALIAGVGAFKSLQPLVKNNKPVTQTFHNHCPGTFIPNINSS